MINILIANDNVTYDAKASPFKIEFKSFKFSSKNKSDLIGLFTWLETDILFYYAGGDVWDLWAQFWVQLSDTWSTSQHDKSKDSYLIMCHL